MLRKKEKSPKGILGLVKTQYLKSGLDFKNICRMGVAKYIYCKTNYNLNDHN